MGIRCNTDSLLPFYPGVPELVPNIPLSIRTQDVTNQFREGVVLMVSVKLSVIRTDQILTTIIICSGYMCPPWFTFVCTT